MWLRLWLKVNLTFLDLDRANLSNKCIYLVSLSVWVSRQKWSALFSHTHTHWRKALVKAHHGSEGARAPHPACPITSPPTLAQSMSTSLSLPLCLHGMALIKCGSLHPVKLLPPQPRWALVWQLSCSEAGGAVRRRERRCQTARKHQSHQRHRRRTGLQTRVWLLWAAQIGGLSLWKSTGKCKEIII